MFRYRRIQKPVQRKRMEYGDLIIWFGDPNKKPEGTPEPEEGGVPESEDLRILRWRTETFEQGGLDSGLAAALACSDADVGLVRKAMKGGASAAHLRDLFL